MALHVLNDEEYNVLKQIVARVRSRGVNERLHDQHDTVRHAPELYMAKAVEETGIPARTDDETPGFADCDIFRITGVGDDAVMEDAGFNRTVYNFTGVAIPQDLVAVALDKFGSVIALQAPGDILVGCCLKEDHPGVSTPFKVYRGNWNPTTNEWVYDLENEYWAIDHRYGTPYPEAGTTGLFVPHPSEGYGTMYECVSLDCFSPGACE